MTLPDIPDEAVALVAEQYPPHLRVPAERALAAVWPHLYAAALRHAAERSVEISEQWGHDPLDIHLRQWADEAERP